MLDRYDADYYECEHCHTLQIPNPTWLEEAYRLENDITLSKNPDSGRFKRNFSVYNYLMALKGVELLPVSPKILDFGGGYGLLTEMLLDSGYDAWQTDSYFTKPLFAPHRYVAEMTSLEEASFDVILAIEVFEHLPDPLILGEQLQRLLKPTGTLIISTGIYHHESHTRDWWYLAREGGQHITLWTKLALEYYANQFQFHSVDYFPEEEGFLIVFSGLAQEELQAKLAQAKVRLKTLEHLLEITEKMEVSESTHRIKDHLADIHRRLLSPGDYQQYGQSATEILELIKRYGCGAEIQSFVTTELSPHSDLCLITPAVAMPTTVDDYVDFLEKIKKKHIPEQIKTALTNIGRHHLRLSQEEHAIAANAILTQVVDKYGWTPQIQTLVERELLPQPGLRTTEPMVTPPQTETEYVAFLKDVHSGQIILQERPTNILLDISNLGAGWYDPVCRVGIYRVVENLVDGLVKSQAADHLAFCATETSYPAFEKTKGYLLAHPQYTHIPLYRLNTLPEADIIHFPYYALPSKINSGQRILTVYDLIPIKYTYFTKDLIEEQQRYLDSLRPTDWVTCISQDTKNDFCDYTGFDTDRVFVTYLAADPILFHPCQDATKIAEVRRKYSIPEEAPYFLTLSNLEPRKNIDHIIHCFLQLVQEQALSDLCLVLVGPRGHHIEQIETAASKLRERIILTGFVDDADMAALYSGATAFLFMSICEGFGLPPLEAMQCGTPVITSNTTSLPEVVGEAGIMLNPTDVDGLCQSMLDLYSNSTLRAEMSSKSLAQAKKFSWNNFIEETLRVYKIARSYGDTLQPKRATRPVPRTPVPVVEMPVTLDKQRPRVLYDVTPLGIGQYQQYGKAGIFRVVEKLADALLDLHLHRAIDLSFCATGFPEAFTQARHYQIATPRFQAIPFYREPGASTADLFHSSFYPFPTKVNGPRLLTVYDLIAIKLPHLNPNREILTQIFKGLTSEDWVTCISQSAKDDLCEYIQFPADKVFVTYLAAEPGIFYPCTNTTQIANIRQKYRIPAEGHYLLSLSTLEPRKNIQQVVRSFAKLVQEQAIQDLYLVLVGAKGWDAENIFQDISQYRSLKGRIIITGYVVDADLAALYSGALAFVYPSFYEGFGLPPLEAMQCGVPVITSNTSSLPEVVGEAGILLDPKDTDGYCQSMFDLYRQPTLRDRLATQSIAQAQKFSWEQFVQDTLKVYQTALLATSPPYQGGIGGGTHARWVSRSAIPRTSFKPPKTHDQKVPQVVYDISILGTGHYVPFGKGGIFRVVEKLASELARLDFENSLALSFCAAGYPEAFKQARGYLATQPHFQNLPLRKLENLSEADIIHFPHFALPQTVTTGRRFLTIHDLIPIKFPQFFTGTHTEDQKQALNSLRPDDWVICVSQATKDDFCEYTGFNPEKVFVTYEGADTNIFYPCEDADHIAQIRQKYRIPNIPYLLTLCTLEPRKNIDQVIRSFAGLLQQEKVTDLCLVLVGAKGWNYDKIFAEISKLPLLQQRVIVTGFVADEDLAALYSGALAFVYPSFYEGFGLPPLEAMQCGIPVITSNTSSLPEVVGDAGILLAPTDTEALCQAIWDLYQQPTLRQALSAKSLTQARKFSWDKFTQDTLDAYQTALLTREEIYPGHRISVPSTSKKAKIIYDISVLGSGHHYARAKTGIFRVVERLAYGLLDAQEQWELVFSAMSFPDSFQAANDYWLSHLYFQNIPLCQSSNLPSADIFHAPFWNLPEEITDCQRILTVYDLIPIKFPHFFAHREDNVQKESFRRLRTSSDWVTCISHATKNDLCEYSGFPADRIFVTHLAADPAIFYPCHDLAKQAATRQKYGIPADVPYVLSLSTLEPRKNIDHLIRSFAHLVLQQNLKELYLVLVGTQGWHYEKIFAEIERAPWLKQRILLTGFVPDEDLAALYSSALVFVYPSLYEGFGLPPLEAMQCGIPVITSNNSSLPEVVGNAGLMLEATDLNGLCQGILNLYQQPALRAELSQKSLAQAQKFSWERFIEETLAVYKIALQSV